MKCPAEAGILWHKAKMCPCQELKRQQRELWEELADASAHKVSQQVNDKVCELHQSIVPCCDLLSVKGIGLLTSVFQTLHSVSYNPC